MGPCFGGDNGAKRAMHLRVEGSSENQRNGLMSDSTAAANGETIAAISTPVGEGAIALVRISGAGAKGVADSIFRGAKRPSEFSSHVQHVGEIHDRRGLVDRVMLAV